VGGERKAIASDKTDNIQQHKADQSPGTSPRGGPNRNGETDPSEDGRKLPEEVDTLTDAVTPGRGVQAGWLNLPHKDLNPFPPVEPVALPSLMATRRCRAATDIG